MAKQKVSRQNWIEAGLIFFSNNGEKGINVEGIAKSLNCSKGSFYYYFKNRENFLKEIINFWISKNTLLPKSIASEAMAWTYLNEMFILKPKDDFLFYLRHYAHENPVYQNMLNVIEKKLLLKIKRILAVISNEDIANSKSEIIYSYYIGWYERFKQSSDTIQKQEKLLKNEITKII